MRTLRLARAKRGGWSQADCWQGWSCCNPDMIRRPIRACSPRRGFEVMVYRRSDHGARRCEDAGAVR
jgi:hypothetical protein